MVDEEATQRHPILDMLGLGPEWKAHVRPSGACRHCGKGPDFIVVEVPGTGPFPTFTPDGYLAIGEGWWFNSFFDVQAVDHTLRQIGIRRLTVVGREDCIDGGPGHEYWRWEPTH